MVNYLGTTLIKSKFTKKLRADCSQGMLAIIRWRIFCLPVCYPKIKIYRTIILLAVLYGCEKWSFKLREECRLKVSENRESRRILGPKMDWGNKVVEKLHNEEFNDTCCRHNIVRVNITRRRWWHVARMWGWEVRTGFRCGNIWEGDHLEDKGVEGRIIFTLWRLTTPIWVVPHR